MRKYFNWNLNSTKRKFIFIFHCRPKTEPVNSLLTRLETIEVFNDNYITDLNNRYANFSLDQSQQAKEQEEK